jgi:hypothetical protein
LSITASIARESMTLSVAQPSSAMPASRQMSVRCCSTAAGSEAAASGDCRAAKKMIATPPPV